MSTREHDISFDTVEHLHDFRLVWTFEIRARLAALESDPRLLGNRAIRILFGGARQSPRLCPIRRISPQDHSRGDHDYGFHCVRADVSEGEDGVELSGGVRVSGDGGVLRLDGDASFALEIH